MYNLTKDQLKELHDLEMEIYNCGIDGGESTSAAIDALKRKEREFGLPDSKHCPRWIKMGEKYIGIMTDYGN